MTDPPVSRETLSFWTPDEGHFPPGVRFLLARRTGGRSREPFHSLNLSLGVGDRDEDVAANRALLRDALRCGAEEPRVPRQVHGTNLIRPDERVEADGFVVQAGDPWVAVSAADCAPVALVAEDGSLGALLHCGWRGAAAGIGSAGVARLQALGVLGEAIRASIGPCLHPCCFPIGPDAAARFHASCLRPHATGQAALDLPEAIRADLVASGVPPGAIATASECTSCAADRYYSHRRDRGLTGRHWAALRLEPAGRGR